MVVLWLETASGMSAMLSTRRPRRGMRPSVLLVVSPSSGSLDTVDRHTGRQTDYQHLVLRMCGGCSYWKGGDRYGEDGGGGPRNLAGFLLRNLSKRRGLLALVLRAPNKSIHPVLRSLRKLEGTTHWVK